MEVVIVAIAALAALVLIDAGYWIALARWSPVIATGVLVGWLAQHYGAQSPEALGVGLLGSVVARHFMRPRFISGDRDFY